MKVPGPLLFSLLFLPAVFLLAQPSSTVYPSVFNTPVSDYNITAMVNEINVTRAIAVTERKFRLEEKKWWFESGMGYLDAFHAEVTQTVHVFSANVDRQLSGLDGEEETAQEAAPEEETADENTGSALVDYFDNLFRDDTYLYSSEASYLILRAGVETNKEEGTQFLNQIRLAMKLPYTQEKWQIFIGDPLGDREKDVVDDTGKVNETTGVGARYFAPEFIERLKTDVSAGIRGIDNPFVQARIEYRYPFRKWLIRPVQYWDYSRKRQFYEETDLYFDRRLSKREMVRLQLQRSTETDKIGMQYAAALSYLSTLRLGTGFRTFVGLAGETKVNEGRYADPNYDDVDPQSGIYRYSLGGGWKASFLRKWLFFEIEPRVDYDMLYNWRPNFVVRYWVEFYFGDI